MNIETKRPGRDGTGARRRNHRGDDVFRILIHPALTRNRDASLPTVARRCLIQLATARRDYRDAVTPALSDELDAAMDALSVAAELGGHHG